MSATILNTDANINAKTVMAAENAETVTGLKTFSRSPNPPFAVQAGSASVANLDVDKLDGLDSLVFVRQDGTVLTGGISFPAVQVVNVGANVLDDYEEGLWTPTIASSGGGAATYNNQNGHYTKVGQRVDCSGYINMASKGTLAGGTITITGLPFTVLNSTGNFVAVSFPYWAGMTTPIVHLGGFAAPNTTLFSMVHASAAAASIVNTTLGDLGVVTELMFTLSYRATT